MPRGASTYVVGIDLGTTYTAAAVHTLVDAETTPRGQGSRPAAGGGRWHMVELGTRATTIPSLVLARADGSTLVGEAAERRAVLEADRVAREFKRRLGDSVPVLLGGSPFSAEQLTAELLRHTLERVVELEGGPPARLALTHPANWGEFKIDVLRAAVQLAGYDPRQVLFITEPEAAALSYAAHDRPPEGAKVAVYDLGGGTFDVAILEDRGDRYALIGEPGGVERLGGIDFDEALFRHVLRLTDGVDALDTTDPSITTDLAALRQACVAAKEALSVETDTTVAVRIGPLREEIRVVRSELEDLIRPTLDYTIDALERALDSAQLGPGDLHAVLLVGGSSRIPLIGQLVSATIGRPIALDIHPKHAVALGAALVAAGAAPAEVDRRDRPAVIVSDDDRPDPYDHPRDPGDPHDPADGPTVVVADAPDRGPTGTDAVPSDRTGPMATSEPHRQAGPGGRSSDAHEPDPNGPRVASNPLGATDQHGATDVSPDAPPGPHDPSDPADASEAMPERHRPAASPPTVARTPLRPGARRAADDAPRGQHGDEGDDSTRSGARPALLEADRPPEPSHRAGGASTTRWIASIALGGFVGLVALLAVLALRDDGDGTATTSSTSSSTSTASSGPPETATPDTTASSLPRGAIPALLVEFFNDLNEIDPKLPIGQGQATMDACAAFLVRVESKYGPAAGDTVVPATLAAAATELRDDAEQLTIEYLDATIRRYQACVAGDSASYTSYQRLGDEKRDALFALSFD